MTEDKLSKFRVSLIFVFERLDITKETFVSIIENLAIKVILNEKITDREEITNPYFKINNNYFSGYDYISFRDKINIITFIEQKRNGRKKCVGFVYELIGKTTVCRIIDFEKEGDNFIYTVEILNDRFNSTEFLGLRKINENEIGSVYSGIKTPYIDPDEHRYEKWIECKEITKDDFF